MCFLAPGVERGEAKIVWTDAQRNEILKFLLVIFIAASKGRRKVCPGKGNEDPDACGSLEMDWERCDITKNLKTVSIIHWFQLHLKCSFLPQPCTIFKNTCYIFFCASLVVKHPGKLDLKKKKSLPDFSSPIWQTLLFRPAVSYGAAASRALQLVDFLMP